MNKSDEEFNEVADALIKQLIPLCVGYTLDEVTTAAFSIALETAESHDALNERYMALTTMREILDIKLDQIDKLLYTSCGARAH